MGKHEFLTPDPHEGTVSSNPLPCLPLVVVSSFADSEFSKYSERSNLDERIKIDQNSDLNFSPGSSTPPPNWPPEGAAMHFSQNTNSCKPLIKKEGAMTCCAYVYVNHQAMLKDVYTRIRGVARLLR
ncbi:unnamed protein product [Phytophthora fragariaefolia]|uniref:Unnamed protein product n=1 Tax=Phytophthora fragariaefolia TaxID=1490495 RepID=A0A9W6YC37_9STRA|nr:unnamed protein product [Phytophthora fragariaefolia]